MFVSCICNLFEDAVSNAADHCTVHFVLNTLRHIVVVVVVVVVVAAAVVVVVVVNLLRRIFSSYLF
jgi:hypothetical protein